MSMLQSTSRRLLLAILEATYGVDAVPDASANAILLKSLTVTPAAATSLKRDLIKPYFGNNGTILTDTYVKIEAEVELSGSGTAGTAPAWDPLLQACGFAATITAATSVVYAPISTGIKSATLYFYNDGALHKVTGAYGDVEFMLQAKQIPTLKFTMTGLYADPSAAALPANTAFKDQAVPVVPAEGVTTVNSVGGYAAAILEKLDLKLGNKVEFRNMPGSQYVMLVDREPSGSIDIQSMTPDVHDFFGTANRTLQGEIALTHGTAAGNIVGLSMPNCFLLNPNYADSQGVQMLSIPFDPTPVSGNDEITLTLT